MARLQSEVPSFGGRVGWRLFVNTLRNAEPITKCTFSVSIVRADLNLNGFPDNVVHISGFHGEDGGIVELNAVSLVNTVFSYGTHRGSCEDPLVSTAGSTLGRSVDIRLEEHRGTSD
jgi:hypothetical protein